MGAQIKNKKSRRHALSEINVTPFVDVMLVLLIIFMVTAPLVQQGIDISLPETDSVGVAPSSNPLILKIRKNRRIYIGKGESIPLRNLSKKLKAISKIKSDKQIYLQADRSVPYGIVAKTLARIKSSGLVQVSLITTAP